MVDQPSPECRLMMALLKAAEEAEGLEFCDRCGMPLYEEALRCDCCCGEFGEPSEDETKEWMKAHPGYFERVRAVEEDFINHLEG